VTTFYLDNDNGNDNYGGTSFALLASAADGALTTLGAFTSASASFPNDGSLIGQYLSIFNGTIYAVYRITAWVSATALTVVVVGLGTPLATLAARQYFIGGRWQTITNGATFLRVLAGDTIRIMASPAPTSIGSATWTGGGRPAAVSIQSSTNATPIRIQTISNHNLAVNDYVVITGHTVNTNANGVWKVSATPSVQSFEIVQINGTNTTGNGVGGATGNVTKANNLVVKTASPLVQNIALCGGLGQKPAWTASANATTAQNTAIWKEGNSSTEINILGAFTTGKAAYYTLPATLDLSAYQQVSFWVRLNTGTVGAAGQAYVALCTDTIGDTVVHQCNIPALGATAVWVPVTVNLGTNLNAAIRSVAFYVVTDVGAQNFRLDNIVACKAASSADSVTLTSLVSKSDGTGDEGWYAIQSINSDVIMLANNNDLTSLSTSLRGYNDFTTTITSYKRETTKTVPAATGTAVVAAVNNNGTSGNLITYSGGWDRTNMSTLTGVTWYDGINGNGIGIQFGNRSFNELNLLNFCRYNVGVQFTSVTADITIGPIYLTACSSQGIEFGSAGLTNSTVAAIWANNNGGVGILFSGTGSAITTAKLVSNNTSNGVSFDGSRYNTIGSLVAGNNGTSTITTGIQFQNCFNSTVGTATLANNSGSGITALNSFNNSVNGGSTSGHTQGVFVFFPGELYLNNVTLNEVNEVATGSTPTGIVYANRLDDTDNNSWVFQIGIGTVNQQTTIVDSPATTSWRMRPTTTTATAISPLLLKLGTVVCAASSAVTVTARMQRSNTGLTMRLICPGGQITGVANDVFSDMTAAANTWQTVTITFTPTKAGAVDIYAEAFGGTTFSGYVCNLTATQA
jgi:hypothetical protein